MVGRSQQEVCEKCGLARISHKVSLRDRSNACPIRLRGQKDAEGILVVRRGGLREQSLMGLVVKSVRMNRPQQEVYEKCGLEQGLAGEGFGSVRWKIERL